MRGRSNQVSRLERELQGGQERIAADCEEIRRSQVAIDQALAERDELAGLEAAGTITAAEARRRLGAIEDKRARQRSEASRLSRVVAKREADLARTERELEHARYEEALAEIGAASTEQTAIAAELGKRLRTAAGAAEKLRAARAGVDEALARANELRPDDVDEWPALSDEPDWGLDQEILEFLRDGPLQPIAAEAQSSAEQDSRQRASDAEQVRLSLLGGPITIRRLPDHLRPEAERRWAAGVKRERERRDRERAAAGLPPVAEG